MIVNELIKLLPPQSTVKTYVEVFGGGAWLLFTKQPSPIEVYNDINQGLANFFTVLKDPDKFRRLLMLVSLTPYSRAEYEHARDIWQNVTDDVARAHLWYIVARMSFGGNFGGSWGYARTASTRNMSMVVSGWLSIIDALPTAHARLANVVVENADFGDIINKYDAPDTLFYCDPPYVMATRKSVLYDHEMTDDDHVKLLNMLRNVRGRVMLSGYDNDIYNQLIGDWYRYDTDAYCSVVGRTRGTRLTGKGGLKGQKRRECVWLNYMPENTKLGLGRKA